MVNDVNAERRIIGVIGLMRGIIASFLRLFICTLLSMFFCYLQLSIDQLVADTCCSILPALAFSLDMFDEDEIELRRK